VSLYVQTIAQSDPARNPRAGLKKILGLDKSPYLVLPATAFIALFVLYPLGHVLLTSVPDFSLAEYERILTSSVYLAVVGRTFETSAIVTATCLVLGYPYAYAMAHGNKVVLAILSTALLLPFWVSLLLRTFSWLILLQDTGLINTLLLGLGIIDSPLRLIRTPFGVTVGMTHVLLPYMVLPLYSIMRKIDPKLMEAAAICGSGQVHAFRRVYLPLSLPGVFAGSVLTFTLALGFYITPALLGGTRDALIGQLIAGQVVEQLNFAFGSALAVVLLVLTAAAFGIFGAISSLFKTVPRTSAAKS
jgi:putative spermidine/putrescine transport system permease protein